MQNISTNPLLSNMNIIKISQDIHCWRAIYHQCLPRPRTWRRRRSTYVHTRIIHWPQTNLCTHIYADGWYLCHNFSPKNTRIHHLLMEETQAIKWRIQSDTMFTKISMCDYADVPKPCTRIFFLLLLPSHRISHWFNQLMPLWVPVKRLSSSAISKLYQYVP